MGAPKNLTETSDVSYDVLIKEGMTKLTYYIFPMDPKQASVWLKIILRNHWEPKSHDRIYIYEGCISILELLTPMNVNHVMKTKKSA